MYEDKINHIAKLARLELDKDLENLSQKFNAIIDLASKLKDIDTTNVEPLFNLSDGNPLERRKDEVSVAGIREELLKNSTDSVSGFFSVPKIVE